MKFHCFFSVIPASSWNWETFGIHRLRLLTRGYFVRKAHVFLLGNSEVGLGFVQKHEKHSGNAEIPVELVDIVA